MVTNSKALNKCNIYLNNLIWYVSLFLIGCKIASISVWMKKTGKRFCNFFSLSGAIEVNW